MMKKTEEENRRILAERLRQLSAFII